MIKLSTIIPIYNKEIALENTLNSIVDYHGIKDYEYECILIDDESTDSCPEICKKFCEEYSYFRYFRIFNNGSGFGGHARNVGLEICRGEFIHFLDADDELLPDFYNKSIKTMNETGVDVYIKGYYIKYKDDDLMYPVTPTEFNDGIIGPPLFSCIFRNYIKQYKFENVRSQDIMFSWLALHGHKYYDDTNSFDSYIRHTEYTEAGNKPINLPYPKNIVEVLQKYDCYPYKLVDNEIVEKFDKTKIK